MTHANNLKALLKEFLPDVYIRFEAFEVEIEIIIAEWVFSLFSAVIPLRLQVNNHIIRYNSMNHSSRRDGPSFTNYVFR